MKKILLIALASLTLFSCKKNEEPKEEPPKAAPKEAAIAVGCYVYDDTKNVISFEITENTPEVKGSLAYGWAEKDKNSGSFVGKFNNGILIGTYTFLSEGTESTRQVAFKLEGGQLIEGYGEMNADGTTFKDVNTLDFSSKMPLTKTDCSK